MTKTSLKPISRLCARCRRIKFRTNAFHIEDTLYDLQKQSESCELCSMRWKVCKQLENSQLNTRIVSFNRLEFNILLDEGYPPVLIIVQDISGKENNDVYPWN